MGRFCKKLCDSSKLQSRPLMNNKQNSLLCEGSQNTIIDFVIFDERAEYISGNVKNKECCQILWLVGIGWGCWWISMVIVARGMYLTDVNFLGEVIDIFIGFSRICWKNFARSRCYEGVEICIKCIWCGDSIWLDTDLCWDYHLYTCISEEFSTFFMF